MLDTALDLFDRHTPCLGHFTAILVDDVLQILRNRGRAVHNEVGVRQTAVDLLDDVHGEDIAIRLAAEFVSAVRRAHRDGERIDLGRADEIDCLGGIGQKLVMG